MMNKLEFSIISEVGNIVKVENFIDYLAEVYNVDVNIFGKISLAVVEAVNNAILYGNKQDPSKYVHFFLE
jgi:serine/threonine-protein kinase RsbW